MQVCAVLPTRAILRDACGGFKSLNDCVASLHGSHNLNIKFNCLKWDVTGGKPAGDVKSLAAPSDDKAMDLNKAIRGQKAGVDFRPPAKTADKHAREHTQDASLRIASASSPARPAALPPS